VTRGGFVPLAPDALQRGLAERIATLPATLRVAIDGPPCARPDTLALSLSEPLRVLGRPVVHICAESFWRDASLRFEYGKQDADSYLNWLDVPALCRGVLEPVVASGTYLPSLRDPRTNRATRELARTVAPGTVVVLSGSTLLGLGLPFELTVHLAVSPASRARRTPADEAWRLPAFERYEHEVRPQDQADIVIRLDDPRHPAITGLRQ
jgi:hypothetical protein